MSHARFYEKAAVADYQTSLLAVIDGYIDQRSRKKEDSQGVHRAIKLKEFVSNHLINVEKLTATQLMWRIYDYLVMPQGSGPLETSQVLRACMMEHLCAYLKITDEALSATVKQLQVIEQNTLLQCVLPSALFQLSHENIQKKSMQQLIRARLLQETAVSMLPAKSIFLEELKIALMTCHQERLMAKIENQWIDIEKLSEHQLLYRLLEHLSIAVRTEQGLFGDNRKLCSSVMRVMSEFILLDEALIDSEVRRQVLPNHPLSPFGPVYQNYDYWLILTGVRLSHMHRLLKAASKDHAVTPIYASGSEIELPLMRKK